MRIAALSLPPYRQPITTLRAQAASEKEEGRKNRWRTVSARTMTTIGRARTVTMEIQSTAEKERRIAQ